MAEFAKGLPVKEVMMRSRDVGEVSDPI